MEVETQNDFLNAVARIETNDDAKTILEKLSSIEHVLKKNPPFRFGPRTIDLDLLLVNELSTIHYPLSTIVIPHPRMHLRRFVLEPLCELIDPEEKHPVIRKTWGELLEVVRGQRCAKTGIVL